MHVISWRMRSLFFIIFVFFKQKTAYEMRISDWSSDVCSSDLRHVVEPQGTTVGQDQPLPDHQCPPLAEGYHAVILADEASALRHQKNAACHCVEDVLRYLCGDHARQVGIAHGSEARRDDADGKQAVGRKRRPQNP